MKQLLLTILITLTMAITSFAGDYTYESSVDPGDFPSYTKIGEIDSLNDGRFLVKLKHKTKTPSHALVLIHYGYIEAYVYYNDKHEFLHYALVEGNYALTPLENLILLNDLKIKLDTIIAADSATD